MIIYKQTAPISKPTPAPSSPMSSPEKNPHPPSAAYGGAPYPRAPYPVGPQGWPPLGYPGWYPAAPHGWGGSGGEVTVDTVRRVFEGGDGHVEIHRVKVGQWYIHVILFNWMDIYGCVFWLWSPKIKIFI